MLQHELLVLEGACMSKMADGDGARQETGWRHGVLALMAWASSGVMAVAFVSGIFSDFNSHRYVFFVVDILLFPVGIIRGAGYWFGFWQ